MKDVYLKSILEKIEKVKNDDSINKVAETIVNAINNGNIIYSFGASHAGILTEEMFYRAGGLALINPIFDKNLMLDVKPITKTSELEKLKDYGKIIAKNVNFNKGDILIAHSVSGRNPVIIDLVMEAKLKGVIVIGITNLTYSKNSKSRHESGRRLYELCDIVLDNHGEIGDATVQFEGISQKVAPTSTVIGAVIVNCLVVEIVKLLKQDGKTIPIFHSANMDGTEMHNKKIFKEFNSQIKYQ